MAVQAQHASSYAFFHDFCNRAGSNNVMEELQLPAQDLQNRLLGLYNSHLGGVTNGTVFSDPHSELTCNAASAPRKRPRDENDPPSLESPGTSTSGRPASALSQDQLVSRLCHQNIEIDALVRLHVLQLRGGLEEARKRHCRALLTGMEQQAASGLRETEAELEKAWRRNAELEEKVRQASAESQMWFAIARNNEAVAASLRQSLEQVLLQNATTAQAKEGYGDTDDAQSCCFVEAEGKEAAGVLRQWRKGACRACGGREACVLVLPCRHLSLCKACESKTDACPACRFPKSACLQIFMS